MSPLARRKTEESTIDFDEDTAVRLVRFERGFESEGEEDEEGDDVDGVRVDDGAGDEKKEAKESIRKRTEKDEVGAGRRRAGTRVGF